MDDARQTGTRAQGSVSIEAGPPDMRRPLVTPRRILLVLVAAAASALVMAWFGPYLGALIVAIITANWLVRLWDNRRMRHEAAERERDLLLRILATIEQREEAARLDDAGRLQRPHTQPRPVPQNDPHIFEARPSPPLSADDMRQKQVEAHAREQTWTTDEILEREG